jgi:hypothetical protein
MVKAKSGKGMKPQDKKHIYAQLLFYAQEKGYNPGWAYYQLKEICGSSIRDTKSVQPIKPTPEILKMITYLNIKNSKRRNKHVV